MRNVAYDVLVRSITCGLGPITLIWQEQRGKSEFAKSRAGILRQPILSQALRRYSGGFRVSRYIHDFTLEIVIVVCFVFLRRTTPHLSLISWTWPSLVTQSLDSTLIHVRTKLENPKGMRDREDNEHLPLGCFYFASLHFPCQSPWPTWCFPTALPPSCWRHE